MRHIIKVEQADCPRGGKHVERCSYKGELMCVKCQRPSAEIDLQLNGPR